jgi:hypothetical protein
LLRQKRGVRKGQMTRLPDTVDSSGLPALAECRKGGSHVSCHDDRKQ